MRELIKKISKKINTYSSSQIEITPYCKGRMELRGIEKSLVLSTLFSTDYIYYIKEQEIPFQGKIEKRHKIIYKISSRYSLIIIVAFYPKVLKVVNVIKTSKSVEKKWRKEILG